MARAPTVGRQANIVIMGPYGELRLSKVTGFNMKAETESVDSTPLNEPKMSFHIPNGWTGEFDVERHDSAADRFFARLEEDFWQNGNLPTGTVYAEVYDRGLNAAPTTFVFEDCSFALDDGGKYEATKKVEMKLKFSARYRRVI